MKYNIVLKISTGHKNSAFMKFTNYLIKKYNLILLEDVRQLNYFDNKEINSIFIPYGFKGLGNITETAKFIEKHKEAKIIRFFNEYNLSEQGELLKIFKKRPIDLYIVNFDYNFRKFDFIRKISKKIISLNCNCLTYYDFDRDFTQIKKYDVIYYGTFRKGREKYFNLYFDTPILYFSTAKKNIRRFRKLINNFENFKCKKIDKIHIGDINSQLRFFRYSLYIEDEFTHQCYNYPANRFYESLSYQVVQFFDKNCINTFNRYGLDISEFLVENAQDLENKVKNSNYLELWKKQEKWKEKVIIDKIELDKILDIEVKPYFN